MIRGLLPSSFLVLGVLCSHALALSAGEDERDLKQVIVEDVQVIMDFQNIQLTFLVRDNQGDFIGNLSADDFLLVENGELQSIVTLRQQEVPISAVVLVDTSWSVRPFLRQAVEAAVNVFRQLESDHAALVFFSDEPRIMLDWDERPDQLSALVEGASSDGMTALHDSVIWVSENMLRDTRGKKLIVLVSDGIDTTSEASFEEMMRTTRAHGVTLYSIFYTNPHIQNYRSSIRYSTTQTRPRGRVSPHFHNMVVSQNRFVEQSLRYGGRTLFSNSFRDLHDIYDRIVQEMKSQYVMLYESPNANEGELRNVRVSTRNTPGKIYINISH